MGTPAVSNKKRLLITLAGMVCIFLLLIGRLFYIQIIQGKELQEKALPQWTRDTSLTAKRGDIVDSTGVVLAQSGTAYKILIWPNSIKEGERMRVATELAKLLDMDYTTVLGKVSDTKKKEIVLKRAVERDIVDAITALKLGNGVVTAIDSKRYYNCGSLFSQLLGFTTVDGVGQSGLEQKYDNYLSGKNGRMITETDRRGNALAYGVQEMIEPVDGYEFVLTTDSVIQSFMEKALKQALTVNKAKSAQGILVNCKTGAIVAISSQPDYDPNNPPRDDLAILSDLSKNKIVSDAYEPGSTFKVVTLSAALDSGTVTTATTYHCPGYHMVNGEKIRCWKSGGHGDQDLTKATQNSCNRAFMGMALEMGKEKFYDYIYAFGFGVSTGSGVPGESSGIVTHEKYIKDNTLARIGFGQSIAVTPIQLASAVGAAVNGGNLMQPYVVDRIVAHNGEVILQNKPTVVRRVISEDTSKTVRTILESVVAQGSGKNAGIPGYRVGGKTGTAQKYENGKVADGKLIASFIGFAPADDPQFVCLILVDEPKVGTIFGSTVAAPFVKEIMEETLRHSGFLPNISEKGIIVPDLSELSMEAAVKKLKDLGLDAVHQEDDTVIAQIPEAGSTVRVGSQVILYTQATDVQPTQDDDGDDNVTVPDVSGKTRLQANDLLKEKGLKILIDPIDQWGTAIWQVPAAGAKVPRGTEVLVDFSHTKIGE
ncbi:MAG: penicillin-binding transpeptidase domain-containing protein [Clostridia bacterium]